MNLRHRTPSLFATNAVLLALGLLAGPGYSQQRKPKDAIRHVVIIFDENVSFDHYFATYPNALNPPGEPPFHALPGTPQVDGLSGKLLTENPNFLNKENGAGAANPFRLSRAQASTTDQSHSYMPEQLAFHGGKMDLFPKSVGRADNPEVPGDKHGIPSTAGLVMGYFDGNTVTAFWNYAQHFAMSDRQFDVTFGPSTPGVINLISGQTNGAINDQNAASVLDADGSGGFTLIADPDPFGDRCSSPAATQVHMTGPNIGNLLTRANVRWGFFQGGFDLTSTNPNGTSGCHRTTAGHSQLLKVDYIAHHEGFQYFPSTANPQHTRPSSVKAIGSNNDGGANHQYDLHDFFDAVKAGNFPAVSYLRAPGYQDGHAGYSNPLDEQTFVVNTINFIQQQKDWEHTAIIIAYDDSDGWYDHVMGKIVNGSQSPLDALDGPGKCGTAPALPGVNPTTVHAQGRCGFGPRLPLLVISPWAKANYVDHTVTDQTSTLRFIEDLFLNGQRLGAGSFDAQSGSIEGMFDFSSARPKNTKKLILDPATGEVK